MKESHMVTYILCFVAGLIIGWNFLPQPDWIKQLVDKLLGRKNGEKNV